MPINAHTVDRIPMSQKERDVLKIVDGVLRGERTQAQASRRLKTCRRMWIPAAKVGGHVPLRSGKSTRIKCFPQFRQRAVRVAQELRYSVLQQFVQTFRKGGENLNILAMQLESVVVQFL
jgi:hypothetical protein